MRNPDTGEEMVIHTRAQLPPIGRERWQVVEKLVGDPDEVERWHGHGGPFYSQDAVRRKRSSRRTHG